KSSVDKDLYGKPGLVFIHEGGVQGMAADLKEMLSNDFSKNLNRELYHNHAISPGQQQPENTGNQIIAEELEEIDAAVEAVRKGKWDEFVAARPYINAHSVSGNKQERQEKEPYDPDWEEKVYPDDLDPFWQAVEDDWFPGVKKFWSTPFDKEDRLVIGSIEKHENQSRGFKL
ncbi:MAG: hypothetical protein LBF62_03980, partial [Tannerellaceae bacterium]|nr:hypothetical protein [Tannerellaceae bacterium]